MSRNYPLTKQIFVFFFLTVSLNNLNIEVCVIGFFSIFLRITSGCKQICFNNWFSHFVVDHALYAGHCPQEAEPFPYFHCCFSGLGLNLCGDAGGHWQWMAAVAEPAFWISTCEHPITPKPSRKGHMCFYLPQTWLLLYTLFWLRQVKHAEIHNILLQSHFALIPVALPRVLEYICWFCCRHANCLHQLCNWVLNLGLLLKVFFINSLGDKYFICIIKCNPCMQKPWCVQSHIVR